VFRRNAKGQANGFRFIQNITILLAANGGNLGSVKEVMQILIANSFPFSLFTFRLTVLII
jgi:hypothetical protein